MNDIRPAKTSFFEATSALVAVCRQIDEGGEIDAVILAEFGKTTAQLAESIDRRKYFNAEISSKIELAKSYKKDIDTHIKRLEKIQERLKKLTIDIMEQNPDVPYKDSLGRKLTVCESAESLKLDFDMKANKTFSVLDPEAIELLGIDHKYVREVSFLTLDTDQIKQDLVRGENLPWAHLHKTPYLRGL